MAAGHEHRRAQDGGYDLGVVIGRFQPFHDGHLALLRQALARAGRVLVVIGSAGAARRPDTLPFTAAERQAMIEACLSDDERQRTGFVALHDIGDDSLWNAAVREAVDAAAWSWGLNAKAAVAPFGCEKDPSSYYLQAFPQWTLETIGAQCEGLSATSLRDLYFDPDPEAAGRFLADARQPLPAPVRAWLAAFRGGADYAELVEEAAFAKAYRAPWAAAPYPPVFVTADAVLIHRQSVLLIERARRPGRGLWALPGGFLDADERLLDAAVRELWEETSIRLPEPIARAAPGRVFDAPRRDIRGRTVTHAFLFHLPADAPRPEPRAADDAAHAEWRDIDGLASERLYSDHFQIIQAFARMLRQGGEG
jgi:bifunctional NMN adenylyltransferase/nudix hydrolase